MPLLENHVAPPRLNEWRVNFDLISACSMHRLNTWANSAVEIGKSWSSARSGEWDKYSYKLVQGHMDLSEIACTLIFTGFPECLKLKNVIIKILLPNLIHLRFSWWHGLWLACATSDGLRRPKKATVNIALYMRAHALLNSTSAAALKRFKWFFETLFVGRGCLAPTSTFLTPRNKSFSLVVSNVIPMLLELQ